MASGGAGRVRRPPTAATWKRHPPFILHPTPTAHRHATPRLPPPTHRMRSMSLSALSSLNRQCSSSWKSALMRSATCMCGERGRDRAGRGGHVSTQQPAVTLPCAASSGEEPSPGMQGAARRQAPHHTSPHQRHHTTTCHTMPHPPTHTQGNPPRSAAASCPPSCLAPSPPAAARETCAPHPRRPEDGGGVVAGRAAMDRGAGAPGCDRWQAQQGCSRPRPASSGSRRRRPCPSSSTHAHAQHAPPPTHPPPRTSLRSK